MKLMFLWMTLKRRNDSRFAMYIAIDGFKIDWLHFSYSFGRMTSF